MTTFLASQIFAGFAFACAVSSMQCRRRRTLLLWLSTATLLSTIHFFLLGRISAGTLYIILVARLLVSAYTTDRRVMTLFALLAVGLGWATYERPLDALAGTAALTAIYASFQADAKPMRIGFMLCGTQWMIHNIIAGSPVAVLMEATIVSSNMVGYWRHHLRAAPGPPEPPAVNPAGDSHEG